MGRYFRSSGEAVSQLVIEEGLGCFKPEGSTLEIVAKSWSRVLKSQKYDRQVDYAVTRRRCHFSTCYPTSMTWVFCWRIICEVLPPVRTRRLKCINTSTSSQSEFSTVTCSGLGNYYQ